MSDEMAVGDNSTSDESKVNSNDTAEENDKTRQDKTSEHVSSVQVKGAGEVSPKPSSESPETEEAQVPVDDAPEMESISEQKPDIEKKEEDEDIPSQEITEENSDEEKRGIKRRASIAFSDTGDEEFKGFDKINDENFCGVYYRVLERLEEEVQTAVKDLKPVRSFKASLSASVQESKRPRQDTDGSRPSSALSSRSDGDSTEMGAAPGIRGRRSTTEMSSPLLRAPLERGWRRELVYRAALDAHSRRNADIYYYTPQGKKLRSTREVAENLAGTGLTLENFSFFKEPLGVDDPEKEVIRDAKLMRRVESPVPVPVAPTIEGKRTPKPKPPKGASPEPATPKSPPAKIKVKSVGSRLSNNGTPPAASVPKQPRRTQSTAATAASPAPASSPAPATANAVDNNTAALKKPRAAALALPQPPPLPPPQQLPLPPLALAPPPPPLQSRPLQVPADTAVQNPQQVVQPCSMSCGRGAVPSLACVACLCLYHPACAGLPPALLQHQHFLCKNCRKTSSPPLEPPPLTHKSGATASAASGAVVAAGAGSGAVAARRPASVSVPPTVSSKVRPDKRVMLRMKVAGGGADGSRVWAVAAPTAGSGAAGATSGAVGATSGTTGATSGAGGGATSGAGCGPPSGVRPTLPQSLAVLNGRRFIVVPRSLVNSDQH